MQIADFNNDMQPGLSLQDLWGVLKYLDIFVVRRAKFANAPNLLYLNQGNGQYQIKYDGLGSALGRGESASVSDFNYDGCKYRIIEAPSN